MSFGSSGGVFQHPNILRLLLFKIGPLFATAQCTLEQEWLQARHRFGMVGVRVEVKIPVDREDAQSTMQKMQVTLIKLAVP